MRNWSIKRKLTLITMAVTTAALLLVAAGFIACEWVAVRSAMIQSLKTQAQMTGERSAAAVSFEEGDSARQYLETLRFDSNIVAACIYVTSPTNQVLASYQAPGRGDSELIPPQPRPDGVAFDFANDSLTAFQTITDPDQTPIGAVYLKSNLQAMRARLKQVRGTGGGLSPAFMGVDVVPFFPASTRDYAPDPQPRRDGETGFQGTRLFRTRRETRR